MVIKTFSIIMPIYGVEKYLRQGIDSVLNQTYDNYEIILVDDCSPDASPSICDEYAAKDERIKVIHKPKNEGLSEARNTGFAAAKGEFIFYMDSDDTIEPTLLETTLDAMSNGEDIVVFGLRCVHEDANGEVTHTETLNASAFLAENISQIGQSFVELSRNRIFPYAWNKVYRRSFLDKCNIKFKKTKLIEDFLFNITVFEMADKIRILNDVLYNYRKPAHQTLASSYSPEFFSLTKNKFALEREFLNKCGVATDDNIQFVMFNHLKHIISTIIRNSSKRANLKLKEQKGLIRQILNDDDTKFVLSHFIPSGIYMKLICGIMKTGSPTLCLLLAKAIDFVKNNLWIISREERTNVA